MALQEFIDEEYENLDFDNLATELAEVVELARDELQKLAGSLESQFGSNWRIHPDMRDFLSAHRGAQNYVFGVALRSQHDVSSLVALEENNISTNYAAFFLGRLYRIGVDEDLQREHGIKFKSDFWKTVRSRIFDLFDAALPKDIEKLDRGLLTNIRPIKSAYPVEMSGISQ